MNTVLGAKGLLLSHLTTTPLHLVLYLAAVAELTKNIPVHSIVLSSSRHLFFCLHFLLFPPFTLSCRIVFANPENFEMSPYHLGFHFLAKFRSSSYFPMAAWIVLRISSLVTWSLYGMFSNLQ